MKQLTHELVARYDGEDVGTGNFQPDDVLAPGGAFFVVRVADEAIGCGGFKRLDRGAAELKRIYIAPAYRGRGYAAMLLGELERRAAAAGYRLLRLESGTRQPESLRLYERCRYQRIPNFGPYVGSPWSVCYEKSISDG